MTEQVDHLQHFYDFYDLTPDIMWYESPPGTPPSLQISFARIPCEALSLDFKLSPNHWPRILDDAEAGSESLAPYLRQFATCI